jgi:hypothetical protein
MSHTREREQRRTLSSYISHTFSHGWTEKRKKPVSKLREECKIKCAPPQKGRTGLICGKIRIMTDRKKDMSS